MTGTAGGPAPSSGHVPVVELTRELVAIPSVNPTLEEGGSGERGVAERCAEELRRAGWAVELIEVAPGRWNVSALRGDSGPTLLLNGHLDTVGIEGMTVDPWGADSTSERIVGRGACDMKAGVATVLEVARRAHAGEWPGRLHILLTADEEHASLGMQAAVAAGVRADFAVVTEPTSLAVMPAHKGFAWVRATFRGRAAHGSRPDRGVDAVRAAARFIAGLDRLDDRLRSRPPHPLMGHGSWHVGTIAGGSAPSVYPERCEVVLERRTLPDEPPAAFLGELRTLASEIGADGQRPFEVDFQEDLLRDGSDVAPDHPGVVGLLGALADEGHPADLRGMTAWVDAAFLNAAGIPAVCFGPGSIEEAHTADESCPVAEIAAAADVLATFSERFLRGKAR